jgi:hypothetical protein
MENVCRNSEKFPEFHLTVHQIHRGAPKGGCWGAAPPKPKNQDLKNTDYVDVMISNVLRDLPFSRNQPLKLVDNWYIRILRNKLIKLKKDKIRHCD